MFQLLSIIALSLFSVGTLSSALAENFTVPTGPLSISNSGFIMAPSSMIHPNEYATVIEEGKIKHFTNILLSRGEPISARDSDGVYKKLSIDAQTGTVSFSGSKEITRAEVLADLRAYFMALKMDQDSRVQKFMTKYFKGVDDSAASPAPAIENSPTSPNTHQDNTQETPPSRPRETSPDTRKSPPPSLPIDPNPSNAPQKRNLPDENEKKEPQAESKNPSSQPINKFNKRFQLTTFSKAQKRKINRNGQITLEGSGCGASLVSRVETDQKNNENEEICKVGFLTAGHCIPTQSELSLGGDPKRPALDNLRLETPSGITISASAKDIDVVLSEQFNGRKRFVSNGQGQQVLVDRQSVKDDYAMIFFQIACSAVKEDELSHFATKPMSQGDKLSAITQNNTEAQSSFLGRSSDEPSKVLTRLADLGSVQPGDSGGPVFNDRGELVGAISNIIVNANAPLSSAHGMTFEAEGIRWAQQQIEKHHGVKQNTPSKPQQNHEFCDPETGICQIPPTSPSQRPGLIFPRKENALLPRINNGINNVLDRLIPRRTEGPLIEVGPVKGRDLEKIKQHAKQQGFRQVVVRYGNDLQCPHCKNLGDNLKEVFKDRNDVLIIKVEDSRPIPNQGIPQSELISLDENGNWKQQGNTQVGSHDANGTSKAILYRSLMDKFSPRQHSPRQPAQEGQTNPGQNEERDFECVSIGGAFRPQHKQAKQPLGAGLVPSLEICKKVISASRNGVVCSATGRDEGYKPTYLSGKTLSRADYGYVGGSSMTLEACLFATEHSLSSHVCYYGGEIRESVATETTPGWYATHPTGDRSQKGGPFASLRECVGSFRGTARSASPPPKIQIPKSDDSKRNPSPSDSNSKKESATQSSHVIPSVTEGHRLIKNNCTSCHDGKTERPLPDWLTQPGEFERRLSSSDPTEKARAQSMVKILDRVLNTDNNMPPKSAEELRKNFDKDPETEKFKAWISQKSKEISTHSPQDRSHNQSSRSQASTPFKPANNAIHLLPQERERVYRSILPQVENAELAAVLKDPNTLFFDKSVMVPGYQDPSLPVAGVRTTEEGFRGAGFASKANQLYLNKEGHLRMFHSGVGLEGATNSGTFHFIHLPKDANGNLQKIKVSKKIIPPDETFTYDWEFPVGTVSGEVVVNKDSQGNLQVLEIRTRKKDQPNGSWAPDIMRPYPTAGSLREKLSSIAKNSPDLKPEAEQLLMHLSNPNRLSAVQISRDGYQKGNFSTSGGTDWLPNMSGTMIKTLLATPFKSTLGIEWDRSSNQVAFAPTTQQSNGIVAQNSHTGATRVDRQSCAKCHEDSNQPIRNFFNSNHPDYYGSIVAYGNLPGSDKNLRFTIFDQKHFRNFGTDGHGDNRKINESLRPILDER